MTIASASALSVSIRHTFRTGFTLDAAFVAPPGVTVLFGPSGCGKSTVLNAVAGLLRPNAGRIRCGEITLLDTEARIEIPAERRRCGVVFQDARLFPHLSVASNLRYGARRAVGIGTGPAFETVVALLGLETLLRRRPFGLSGGERQRVALGRALLARPRLLLMDEPLAALDAARRVEILPFLARLRAAAGVPILYVTHALDEVDALADTLVLLDAGRVVAAGSLESLAARPDLSLLAGRRDAGAILFCRVLEHDLARGLTRLAFAGGVLVAPLRPETPGSVVRLRLRARDVAVAVAPPVSLSTANVIPATVVGLTLAGPGSVFVQLSVGESVLLARVLADTVAALGLQPGSQVWALIKAVALEAIGPAIGTAA